MERAAQLAPGLVLLACLTSSLPASSQVLTTQDRSVQAQSLVFGQAWAVGSNPFSPDFDPPDLTQNGSDADDASAGDFGPFSATASSVDSDSGAMLFTMAGAASASQTSSLSAASITAQGSYTITTDSFVLDQAQLDLVNLFFSPPTYDYGWQYDQELPDSSFSVGFSIATPTPYVLTGSVALSAAEQFLPGTPGTELTGGWASIELARDGGPVLASVSVDQFLACPSSCVPSSESLDASGILAPGSYTLTAYASGSATGICLPADGGAASVVCFQPTNDGSFELELQLAQPFAVPALGPAGLGFLATGLLALSVIAARRARLRAAS